jgi:hypothetical protein
MRQTPSASPDRHLDARYEALIIETLAQQRLLVDVKRRIEAWCERAADIRPNALLSESQSVRRRLDALMRERVSVLQAIESLPTIEDVFPRVRRHDLAGTAAADASTIVALFDRCTPHPTVVASGTTPSLSLAEARAFRLARGRLCRKLGFDVEQDHEAIVLRRGRKTIRMLHFALPSSAGLGGDSRISHMTVHAREGRKDVLKFNFDRGWDPGACCSDVDGLREIDRVVAALG